MNLVCFHDTSMLLFIYSCTSLTLHLLNTTLFLAARIVADNTEQVIAIHVCWSTVTHIYAAQLVQVELHSAFKRSHSFKKTLKVDRVSRIWVAGPLYLRDQHGLVQFVLKLGSRVIRVTGHLHPLLALVRGANTGSWMITLGVISALTGWVRRLKSLRGSS